MDSANVRKLSKKKLLEEFSVLVDDDRRQTAHLLAYIGEIDRRKLYLEQAYPSMFAFCTERFRMSESIAAKRIRTARAAESFPCLIDMIRSGELHLTGAHRLAPHLTEENHRELLQQAKHRSTREIEALIVSTAPMGDVGATLDRVHEVRFEAAESRSGAGPLSPGRYRLQVTIGEQAHAALTELQGLLSHLIPDGDLAVIVERALVVLLSETKKRKAALTPKPRSAGGRRAPKQGRVRGRSIPAEVKRKVFLRDGGRCAFKDSDGRRCGSTWQVEFHHEVPFAKGGKHEVDNIQLRCRAHNQWEAEKDLGAAFMEEKRTDSGKGRRDL